MVAHELKVPRFELLDPAAAVLLQIPAPIQISSGAQQSNQPWPCGINDLPLDSDHLGGPEESRVVVQHEIL